MRCRRRSGRWGRRLAAPRCPPPVLPPISGGGDASHSRGVQEGGNPRGAVVTRCGDAARAHEPGEKAIGTTVKELFSRDRSLFSRDRSLFSRDRSLFSRDSIAFLASSIAFLARSSLFWRARSLFWRARSLSSRARSLFSRARSLFSRARSLFSRARSLSSRARTLSSRVRSLSSRARALSPFHELARGQPLPFTASRAFAKNLARTVLRSGPSLTARSASRHATVASRDPVHAPCDR